MNLREKYPKNFEYCFDLSISEGWRNIIEKTIEDIIELHPDIEILQIKEKFGGLRLYTGGTIQEVHDRIKQAELECSTTCEVCGDIGEFVNNKGWYSTLCKKHRDE